VSPTMLDVYAGKRQLNGITLANATMNTEPVNDISPRKKPKQARSIATKRRIIQGARKILQTQGRNALTARRLASTCGVTTGALYDHFPSISAVLFQLYKARLNQELEIYKEVYGADDGSSSPDDLLDRHIQLDAEALWGDRADAELDEAVRADPKLTAVVNENQAEQRHLLKKTLLTYHPRLNNTQAATIARYIVELSYMSYRTRQAADVEDAQLVRNITLKVMRQLLNAEDLPGG